VIVVWTKTALTQLADIYDYWNELNPYAATDLYNLLFEAGHSLANIPRRGRLVRNKRYREIVVIRPYAVRYRITKTTVYIIRVRHTARRSSK